MSETLYPSGVLKIGGERNWDFQSPKDKRKKHRQPLTNLTAAIDRSVKEGGFWEKVTFTVPASTSEERVQLVGHKYMLKAAKHFEGEGLKVKKVLSPTLDLRPLPVEPDRRRYIIYVFLWREPYVPVFDVPDACVPDLLKAGLRLME